MRTLEGIRYLINLDSAEIQQNFAGGVAPPDKVESEVAQLEYLYVKSRVGRNQRRLDNSLC